MKSNLTSLLSKDRTLCLALVPKDFLLFSKSFMVLYFSFICWKGYLFYIDCFCAFVRNLLDIFVWVFLWVNFIELSKEIIVFYFFNLSFSYFSISFISALWYFLLHACFGFIFYSFFKFLGLLKLLTWEF